jgi:hypothetical protein|tara:strand:- start:381 stop:662 length:282 start_codon:yes stop_codon:yes gene_type:complete
MNQVLTPVTQMLKRNSVAINMVMLGLVILFLFPVKHFIPYDIKEKVESELKEIMQVPWIMAIASIFVLCVFYSGDVKMLALALYIIHYLVVHQ